MESIGLGQEAGDLQHSFDALLAGDEAAFDRHHERHDSVAGGPDGDQVFISREDLNCHAGVGMRALPVVAKTGLLHHGEQFVIVHGMGGGADFRGECRLAIAFVDGANFVGGGLTACAEKSW